MLRYFYLLLAFLQFHQALSAQYLNKPSPVDKPENFAAVVTFLSSGYMEGREAGSRGASLGSDFIALMMQINGIDPFGDRKSWFQDFKLIRFRNEKPEPGESEYNDSDYFLEGDTTITNASQLIDTLPVRNVIGIIPGNDTSKSIVIGAHYDHLGMRNGLIFYGADDNASGVAGMLSLAKKWVSSGEKPQYNLIFCAWTAEEKGQLGSSYFVRNMGTKTGKVLICFNMDMISRSAPEDTTGRQISIGTLPFSEDLRLMAKEINLRFERPFEFDLWDVTGHTGSDYRFFSEAGIPVMTFFSGYNSDYHTTADTSDKIDLRKMSDILILVDEIIRKVLRNSYGN
ncbi:MAG TPA: hypothetical protein DEO60_01215 [Bacteroidales bacterium]|nr:hypothetical protein [Bacteroidales bacterium]HBZ19721.1 hypothetical protein [Bacteroidales bacterium]